MDGNQVAPQSCRIGGRAEVATLKRLDRGSSSNDASAIEQETGFRGRMRGASGHRLS